MKLPSLPGMSLRLFPALLGVCPLAACSQTFIFDTSHAVPDGSSLGLADGRVIGGVVPGAILTVRLSLRGIGDGMLNGDLYASIAHENDLGAVDAFAVLLNRPGRRAEDEEGYKDSGMEVAFTAAPGALDIHNYRLPLTGSASIPLTTKFPADFFWSADGRQTDPDLVLDTDPRTASLSGFAGVDPNAGRWTLFIADLVPGGEAYLNQWSLSFTAIPEPPSCALVGGLLAMVSIGWRWIGQGPKGPARPGSGLRHRQGRAEGGDH